MNESRRGNHSKTWWVIHVDWPPTWVKHPVSPWSWVTPRWPLFILRSRWVPFWTSSLDHIPKDALDAVRFVLVWQWRSGIDADPRWLDHNWVSLLLHPEVSNEQLIWKLQKFSQMTQYLVVIQKSTEIIFKCFTIIFQKKNIYIYYFLLLYLNGISSLSLSDQSCLLTHSSSEQNCPSSVLLCCTIPQILIPPLAQQWQLSLYLPAITHR